MLTAVLSARMIISHSHRFIFVANGRTASKTIEAALAHLHEAVDLDTPVPGLYTKGHIPPTVIRERIPAQIWDHYTKFMFVRNPWDWVVSQYFYNFVQKPLRRLRQCNLESGIQMKRSLTAAITHLHGKDRLTLSDLTILFEHLRQYRGVPETASLFQSSYAYDRDGTPLVDFIGRFECLERDFDAIAKRLGLEVQLPRINGSSHDKFQTYYSDETIKLVADLYETDIANFGYSWLSD
jgi:Sulfotransferase family